jgi:hypothetical protein
MTVMTIEPVETRAPGSATSGGLLFARFAFPPNALGLCGPDAGDALAAHVRDGRADGELRRLAMGFEGAWPYLELIAGASGIADPLDPRVVEAYWLGGPALAQVRPQAHHEDMIARFRRRAAPGTWRWLESKAGSGARVHHSFHVLEVLPRIGLLRGGVPQDLRPVLEHCLVRPGVVVAVDGDQLQVDAVPLELVDGRLRLGEPRRERLAGGPAASYGDDLVPGDRVALHWDRVCGRLSPDQASRLTRVTQHNLAIANTTI